MELQELIWNRLIADDAVTEKLTRFDGLPAIFTPEAPPDNTAGWNGLSNYPRITFTLDLSANEERKCQGGMIVSIFAKNEGDYSFAKAADDIKKCLCDVFLVPDGESPYCLAWNRSDGFAIDGLDICGMEMQFDILEYPCQETTDPDPVDALNTYLRSVFPEAVVLWHDHINTVEAVKWDRPVFYCRLESDSEDDRHSTFAVTWMECSMVIHIFCTNPYLRGKYARVINKKLGMDMEFPMLDDSPFLVSSSNLSQAADYLRVGQIKLSGRYGILRQTEKKKKVTGIENSYSTGG